METLRHIRHSERKYMLATSSELNKTLSGFSLDHDGSFSAGIHVPFDGQIDRHSYSVAIDDANDIQWWFAIETTSPGIYSVFLRDGVIKDEISLSSIVLNVKPGDQEDWRTYELSSFIQDISVPSDLTKLFSQVIGNPLYTPVVSPKAVAVKAKRKAKALVVECDDLLEALEAAGYEALMDNHDEPVLTVLKRGETFQDMAVYLEFKELDGSTDRLETLILFRGSQETLSNKKDAGEFDTKVIQTIEELIVSLGESFNAWKEDAKRFQ